MLMMGYANPFVAYGIEEFIHDAKEAGANGLIVPDLPPEEAHLFADACEQEGMALIFFLAPTSNEKRIELVAQQATGFIYLVSITGITGARNELPANLQDFIARVRAKTDQKLVLGFGISTPQHVQMVSQWVDGYIVGSALVKKALEGTNAVRELAETLKNAMV
jgi:tryptophan synthase alpha chain